MVRVAQCRRPCRQQNNPLHILAVNFRGPVAEDREESLSMIQLDAAGKLAEARNRNVRDKIKLIQFELEVDQEDSSASASPQLSQSPARD